LAGVTNIDDVFGVPLLTLGGVSANSMTTPHQLDGFLHCVEMDEDESTTGDWHNDMGSTTGSMGGESNKSVVWVFVMKEGA
jgi:hypothetical protein